MTTPHSGEPPGHALTHPPWPEQRSVAGARRAQRGWGNGSPRSSGGWSVDEPGTARRRQNGVDPAVIASPWLGTAVRSRRTSGLGQSASQRSPAVEAHQPWLSRLGYSRRAHRVRAGSVRALLGRGSRGVAVSGELWFPAISRLTNFKPSFYTFVACLRSPCYLTCIRSVLIGSSAGPLRCQQTSLRRSKSACTFVCPK
jgi:hypothetical protein